MEEIVSEVLAAAHPNLRQRCAEDKILSGLNDLGAYDVNGLHALLDADYNSISARLAHENAAPLAFLALLSKRITQNGVAPAHKLGSLSAATTPPPIPATTPPPVSRVKILVVVSNPRKYPLQCAHLEAEAVAVAWGDKNGDVVIEGLLRGITVDGLPGLIAEHKPNVLHFIGHVANDQEGCRIVLLDSEGELVYVTKEVLSRCLGSLSSREFLKVVILSACESDEPAVALSDFGLYTFCWDSLALDEACLKFAQQVHKHIATRVSEPTFEPLVQTLDSAFEQGILAFDSDPKFIVADPLSSGHHRTYRVNGKLAAGTPLLLRPRLGSDKLIRVPPSLQSKYVACDKNNPRMYPSCTEFHAVKLLLRYRYAFQFVESQGHVVCLHGQSGVGTSTLAIMLVHNPCVQSIYSDGVFWVDSKLGLNDERMRQLAREVSGGNIDELKRALNKKRCLIVLDGALHKDQIKMLLDATSGRQQTVMFTTRRSHLADEGNFKLLHTDVSEGFACFIAPLINCIQVEQMCPNSAQRLLVKQFPQGSIDSLAVLAKACEYLPRGLMEAIELVCKGRFDLAGAAKYVKDTGALKRFFRPSLDKWEREWDSIKLVKCIGGGATGKVYQATCSELASVDLAAKVMNHNLDIEEHRQFVKMLSTEVQALAQINHPNVVRMFGVSVDQPHQGLCLLMELMPKGSLRSVLNDPIKSTEVLSNRAIQFRIVYGIVKGMAFLHSRATLHHDCKSANVLIDDDWTAKLCDFGMATGIGMTSLSLVNTSSRTAPELTDTRPLRRLIPPMTSNTTQAARCTLLDL